MVVLSDDTPQSASELSTALLASAGAWLDKTMTFVSNTHWGLLWVGDTLTQYVVPRSRLRMDEWESTFPMHLSMGAR